MDYYPTVSAQETKQTNILTLTVSCEKSSLIRRNKMNKRIIIIKVK